MKKLLLITAILFCGCGETEEKKMTASDSLSAAMDSARAHDTFLLKLKSDTSTKIKIK